MTESPDARAAIDRLERQMREAHDRAAKAQELAARTEQLRVRAVSPRQELAATVDSLGRLTDLELSPRAMQLGEDALAAMIVATVQDAHAQAGQQVMQWSEEAFGAGSQTAAALRETYLPADASEQAGPAAPTNAPYLLGRPTPGASGLPKQPGWPGR